MPPPGVTVVIPTLAADAALAECLQSLRKQSYQDFEVIVVDNSGKSSVRRQGIAGGAIRVIDNPSNVGFGAAINQACRESISPFVAALNDDAVACPEWLTGLVASADSASDVGMVASQVRLEKDGRIDSAGMLICADGSSKQRGHGESPDRFQQEEEALLPSGSAALYRRSMLEEIGGFDESFFLYCEDTDLGLRARWAGWRCLYQPRAMVLHRYSHSAGRASALKAYFVERNRLAVLVRNFPLRALWKAPFVTMQRYWWHVVSLAAGRGSAAEFGRSGGGGFRLAWFVLRAHVSLLARLPGLLRDRRGIRRSARVSPEEFLELLKRHAITAKEVAAL